MPGARNKIFEKEESLVQSKETEQRNPKYMVKSTLLKRPGLTEKTIRDFSPPFTEKLNIHNWRNPVKLYEIAEIERIEALPDFAEYAAERIKQSNAAKKRDKNPELIKKRVEAYKRTVSAGRVRTMEFVDSAEIFVKVLPVNDIVENAFSENRRYRMSMGWNPEPAPAKRRFFWRENIVFWYMINNLTNFRDLCSQLGKFKHRDGAAKRLLRKTCMALCKVYRIDQNLRMVMDYNLGQVFI